MIIRCDRIVVPGKILDGFLEFDESGILGLYEKDADVKADLDYCGKRIIPGIFDTHNHGGFGYVIDPAGEDIKDQYRGYLKALGSVGVTSIFPTVTRTIKVAAEVAKENPEGARIVGIHSEGPYLNRVGEKGIDTGHPDISLDTLDQMVSDGEGLLKLVAIAPELPGAKEAIEFLVSKGIRVAYAHSNNNYKEALESFSWGITVSTHTANVMSGIHHRNMGGLGACLLDEDIWCEVICDGLHVSPEMLTLMFKVKSPQKFMMVSDNGAMAGAPVGRYRSFGWMDVTIDEQGFCLSDTGRLCGSTKPVLFGIGVLVNKVGLPLTTVCEMASAHPAQVYGLDKKGALLAGKDADFVVIDENYQALATWREGKKIYDRAVDTDLFAKDFLKEHLVTL